MTSSQTLYDVAIIGTGMGGSILGTILARQGLNVVMFEAACHPKFAIGESMILESSEALRLMAIQYDVPELAYFSSENYRAYVGNSHGVKRHFGFMHHQANHPHDPNHVLQAVIPREPYGHELHLYRQDSDYYFMSLAIRYGATVFQKTGIEAVDIADDCVNITTQKGTQFQAQYIVDAGGFRSLLAQKYDLRDYNLQVHSRSIFTHMIDVPSVHHAGPSQEEQGVLHSMFEGTLHHIFPGGWLWVIPFNNHKDSTNPLCSVGLMLDPRQHPKPEGLSAQEEFDQFVQKYPSIHEHLKEGKPVRDWVSTGRIQYSSKRVVGDRFCLLGHAAGFIDPLFSRGLYITFASITVLAQKLIDAHQTQDYSRQAFLSVEDLTLKFLHTNDRLVANAYRSFQDHRLWTLYAINWILGAYLELLKLGEGRAVYEKTGDPASLKVYENYHLSMLGGGFEPYERLHDDINRLMESLDPHQEFDFDAAANSFAANQNGSQLEVTLNAIRERYNEAQWIPPSIKNLMLDKKYLDPRLRNFLRVWKQRHSENAYWQYFFGHLSTRSLLWHLLKDKWRYSAHQLTRTKLQNFRQLERFPSNLTVPPPRASVVVQDVSVASG